MLRRKVSMMHKWILLAEFMCFINDFFKSDIPSCLIQSAGVLWRRMGYVYLQLDHGATRNRL